MKKLLIAFAIVLMIAITAGCGSQNADKPKKDDGKTDTTVTDQTSEEGDTVDKDGDRKDLSEDGDVFMSDKDSEKADKSDEKAKEEDKDEEAKKPEKPKKVIITINGTPIYQEEIDKRLTVAVRSTFRDEEPDKKQVDNMRKQIVMSIINEEMFLQLAKKMGVAPGKKDVDEYFQIINKEVGGNLEAMMAQQGLSRSDLERQAKVRAALINVMTKGAKVTDKEVKETYDKMIAAPVSPVKQPKSARVKGVLVASESDAQKAASRLNTGDNFEKVTKDLCTDEKITERKGDLGWVFKGTGALPPDAVDKLLQMKKGELSSPIQIGEKFLVAKVVDTKEEKIIPYKKIKDEMKQQMIMQKGMSDTKKLKTIQDFVKNSKIVAKDKNYKSLPNEFKEAMKKSMTPPEAGTMAPTGKGETKKLPVPEKP